MMGCSCLIGGPVCNACRASGEAATMLLKLADRIVRLEETVRSQTAVLEAMHGVIMSLDRGQAKCPPE